jgi:hypothetical protein
VDDILTVPFATEELLAVSLRLLRRAYSDAVTFQARNKDRRARDKHPQPHRAGAGVGAAP